MIDTPQIVQTAEQLTAALHLNVPRNELASVMGSAVAEVGAVIHAQAIPITGPWFAHHLRRPTDTFDLEVCFPVASAITPSGRVYPSRWPAMRVARAIYHGPYEGLPGAWGEFGQWIDSLPESDAPDLWERYLVDPSSNPDPAAWRTELNRQLLG